MVELNGQTVISMPEQEILRLMKDGNQSKLNLLVLRKNEPITSLVDKEELRTVKEDLSLALQELKSVQQENTQLNNTIKR